MTTRPNERRDARAPEAGQASKGAGPGGSPGKAPRTARVSSSGGAAVQRRSMHPDGAATGAAAGTDPAGDGWMDAALRGTSPGTGAVVQRSEDEHGHGGHGAHRRPGPEARGGGSGGSSDENPRFDEDTGIANAVAGTDYIRKGDTGMSVRIIQQGLIDAGYELPTHGVDGIFGDETHAAVVRFQSDQGIDPDGIVGPDTMNQLNTVHNTHETVADIAQNQSDPMDGTRTLEQEEVDAFNQAISTEPRGAGGALPTFQPTLPAGDYEARIRARMLDLITRFHQQFEARETQRAQPDSLHDWDDIETVAAASKRETDRVFGGYATGPAFTEGVNLFDAWEEESDAIANDPGYDDYIVDDLAGYILNNYMNEINEEHGAVASRSPERGILETIKNDFIASHRQELLDIQVNWPGLADGGRVSIQIYKESDDAGNRDFMWEQFATIIHEYIHTLEHQDHVNYRSTMDEQQGGLTLREGMCDYFTKVVWDTVAFSPQLRQEVEGPFHDANTQHQVPQPGYYDSATEAERAVGIVGVRNAMAAFFNGRVELIGGGP